MNQGSEKAYFIEREEVKGWKDTKRGDNGGENKERKEGR